MKCGSIPHAGDFGYSWYRIKKDLGEAGFARGLMLARIKLDELKSQSEQFYQSKITELIKAAKDIRDNPGTDPHGSVGWCAIELPKLDRLSKALIGLDANDSNTF